MKTATAIVGGAGGFIGSHLMKRLHEEGYYVIGADLKYSEYWDACAMYSDEFHIIDLRQKASWRHLFATRIVDEVYQLAADMGGAGFIFTGENDSDVMLNSSLINIQLCNFLREYQTNIPTLKVFYSSSACVYPEENQKEIDRPITVESSAYPANPDSEYGWEKLFSERLYGAMSRNYYLDARIARFHNIFGPYGTYEGGREKAPSAICRKIAALPEDGGEIEIWGDGEQTRSFLYVDEAVEAVRRFMHSDFRGPLNIGSEEMVSINGLVRTVELIANKKVDIKHIDGPLGVRGRNSDNRLIRKELKWEPSRPLVDGLRETYKWIDGRLHAKEAQEKRDRSENR